MVNLPNLSTYQIPCHVEPRVWPARQGAGAAGHSGRLGIPFKLSIREVSVRKDNTFQVSLYSFIYAVYAINENQQKDRIVTPIPLRHPYCS